MLVHPNKAMVLAAGLGTRMRPLTDHLPKPLIEVAGTALVDYALNWLEASAIDEVVVNSHYKFELLEAHLAKRTHPAIHISREEPLLETGGGIKKALSLLGEEPFFSLNSDTICVDGPTPALARMIAEWDDKNIDALLLVHPVSEAIGYQGNGDFFLHADGSLRRRQNEEKGPPLAGQDEHALQPRFPRRGDSRNDRRRRPPLRPRDQASRVRDRTPGQRGDS
jgi:MurNAc alpha-1-phosphate uridylyltransferase